MFTAVIHHPFLLFLISEHPLHAVRQGEGGPCSSAKWKLWSHFVSFYTTIKNNLPPDIRMSWPLLLLKEAPSTFNKLLESEKSSSFYLPPGTLF